MSRYRDAASLPWTHPDFDPGPITRAYGSNGLPPLGGRSYLEFKRAMLAAVDRAIAVPGHQMLDQGANDLINAITDGFLTGATEVSRYYGGPGPIPRVKGLPMEEFRAKLLKHKLDGLAAMERYGVPLPPLGGRPYRNRNA